MWKGELSGSINLDTISNKKRTLWTWTKKLSDWGNLLINDGQSYVSRVTSDSTMAVQKNIFQFQHLFFVYTNATKWSEIELGSETKIN